MKATLILSAIAIVSVISTAASAQSFPTSYGNSSATISIATPQPPSNPLITTDRAYAPRAHRVRHAHR